MVVSVAPTRLFGVVLLYHLCDAQREVMRCRFAICFAGNVVPGTADQSNALDGQGVKAAAWTHIAHLGARNAGPPAGHIAPEQFAADVATVGE